MKDPKGLIARIEPFSVQNGPGLRTVVFMKGCPLKCPWCDSPHMQKGTVEILYDPDRCLASCGDCILACPRKAIFLDGRSRIRIDRHSCDGCGLCAVCCSRGALETVGKYYNLKELLFEVEKDILLYKRSDGGVTVSGGEPAAQAEFVSAFLHQCRMRHIHTALETSGSAPWTTLASLLEFVDLVYFDLKHMDQGRHKNFTGVSNRRILKNVQEAASFIPVILRIPIIPDLNDEPHNLAEAIRFAKGLGSRLIHLELIPFHKHGEDPYRKLNRRYKLHAVKPPGDEFMEKLKKAIASHGLRAQIRG